MVTRRESAIAVDGHDGEGDATTKLNLPRANDGDLGMEGLTIIALKVGTPGVEDLAAGPREMKKIAMKKLSHRKALRVHQVPQTSAARKANVVEMEMREQHVVELRAAQNRTHVAARDLRTSVAIPRRLARVDQQTAASGAHNQRRHGFASIDVVDLQPAWPPRSAATHARVRRAGRRLPASR